MSYSKKTIYMDLIHHGPEMFDTLAPEKIGNAGFAVLREQNQVVNIEIQLRVTRISSISGSKVIEVEYEDGERVVLGRARMSDGYLKFIGEVSVQENKEIKALHVVLSDAFTVSGYPYRYWKPRQLAEVSIHAEETPAMDGEDIVEKKPEAMQVRFTREEAVPTKMVSDLEKKKENAEERVIGAEVRNVLAQEPTAGTEEGAAGGEERIAGAGEKAIGAEIRNVLAQKPTAEKEEGVTGGEEGTVGVGERVTGAEVRNGCTKVRNAGTEMKRAGTEAERKEMQGVENGKREQIRATKTMTKWQFLHTQFEAVHPFSDDREYLTLSPDKLYVLVEGDFRLAANLFLLHGYESYQHIVLGRIPDSTGKEEYYIGVPGVFFE